jgi:nitroreductase
MLCRFGESLETYGAIGYKNLYHQCGAIGQMLYLEATSLGLSATGIGCFLDDEFHALLDLHDLKYQSLYHFTIGRTIVDTRISTQQPYPH